VCSSCTLQAVHRKAVIFIDDVNTLSSKKKKTNLKMSYYTCMVTVKIHIFFSHRKEGCHDLE